MLSKKYSPKDTISERLTELKPQRNIFEFSLDLRTKILYFHLELTEIGSTQ